MSSFFISTGAIKFKQSLKFLRISRIMLIKQIILMPFIKEQPPNMFDLL